MWAVGSNVCLTVSCQEAGDTASTTCTNLLLFLQHCDIYLCGLACLNDSQIPKSFSSLSTLGRMQKKNRTLVVHVYRPTDRVGMFCITPKKSPGFGGNLEARLQQIAEWSEPIGHHEAWQSLLIMLTPRKFGVNSIPSAPMMCYL